MLRYPYSDREDRDMDHATWHKDSFHQTTGECNLYGDTCHVSWADANRAEQQLRETMARHGR